MNEYKRQMEALEKERYFCCFKSFTSYLSAIQVFNVHIFNNNDGRQVSISYLVITRHPFFILINAPIHTNNLIIVSQPTLTKESPHRVYESFVLLFASKRE